MRQAGRAGGLYWAEALEGRVLLAYSTAMNAWGADPMLVKDSSAPGGSTVERNGLLMATPSFQIEPALLGHEYTSGSAVENSNVVWAVWVAKRVRFIGEHYTDIFGVRYTKMPVAAFGPRVAEMLAKLVPENTPPPLLGDAWISDLTLIPSNSTPGPDAASIGLAYAFSIEIASDSALLPPGFPVVYTHAQFHLAVNFPVSEMLSGKTYSDSGWKTGGRIPNSLNPAYVRLSALGASTDLNSWHGAGGNQLQARLGDAFDDAEDYLDDAASSNDDFGNSWLGDASFVGLHYGGYVSDNDPLGDASEQAEEIASVVHTGGAMNFWALVPEVKEGGGGGGPITPVGPAIVGRVFEDQNRNGKVDAGERGLTGWQVYVDKNGNGKLDKGEKSTKSGDGGYYQITGLVAGTYTVRQVSKASHTLTAPKSGFYKVTLGAGEVAEEKDFGNYSAGSPTLVSRGASGGSDPWELTIVGKTMFFSAENGTNGRELWKTDGTWAGTKLVKDLTGDERDSDPRDLTVVGKYVYFTAYDGETGRYVFRSDGTAKGTKRLMPSIAASGGADPQDLTAYKGKLFFRGADAGGQGWLWSTDGTTQAKKVKLLEPDHLASGRETVVHNGVMFFVAGNHSEDGRELWRTDGTAKGTYQVAEVNGDSGSSDPRGLVSYKGKLFFQGNNEDEETELWSSDGTGKGTKLVKRVGPVDSGGGDSGGSGGEDPSTASAEVAVANNLLFFRGYREDYGWELWRSDGTAAGTKAVSDKIVRGEGVSPRGLTAMGNFVYFSADSEETAGAAVGRELWRSDGTSAGTKRVAVINDDGSGGADPQELSVIGGTLYFSAFGGPAKGGRELWASKGTAATTRRVVDLDPGEGSSRPAEIVAFNGRLFFTGAVEEKRELWSLGVT